MHACTGCHHNPGQKIFVTSLQNDTHKHLTTSRAIFHLKAAVFAEATDAVVFLDKMESEQSLHFLTRLLLRECGRLICHPAVFTDVCMKRLSRQVLRGQGDLVKSFGKSEVNHELVFKVELSEIFGSIRNILSPCFVCDDDLLADAPCTTSAKWFYQICFKAKDNASCVCVCV